MKIVKLLPNENRVQSEYIKSAAYTECSEYFSIKTVFSGQENYLIDKRKIILRPNTFLVINKGSEYSLEVDSTNPTLDFSISFSSAYIRDFTRMQSHSNAQLLDNPCSNEENHVFNAFDTIHLLTGDMRYNMLNLKNSIELGASDLLINEYLYHCLLNYSKVLNHESADKSEKLKCLNSTTKKELLKRMTLAKEYINSNFSEQVKLDAIASHSCLSVNHLLRTFKQVYGISPYQYLTQIRLQHAKHLLRHSDYNINDIVAFVGFECPSSFIRLFKNYHNLTPGQFRNKAS